MQVRFRFSASASVLGLMSSAAMIPCAPGCSSWRAST